MAETKEDGTGLSEKTGTNGPPPAEAKPSLPPITDDDEDDDIPLGQLVRTTPKPATSTNTTTPNKPASTTPKPAAKGTPKPAAALAKPSATTAKPATSIAKPAASPAKPAAAGTPSKPAASSAKPATPSTAKPAAKPAATSPTTAKPAGTPSKPAATTSTSKPAGTPAKPAATTVKPAGTPSKPAAKPAASTPKANGGDKVEKTTDTTTETTTTPKAIKSTTTTVTTTKTDTPSAASKVTVTTTLATTTPNKTSEGDDSDDDKPLSSLASEKKTVVVKKEKKDNEVVTKEKTTTVKKEVKKEDTATPVKKEVKKETPKKETPKKKPQKRKAESSDEEESSEDEKPKKKSAKKKKVESDSDVDSDDEPLSKKAKGKSKVKKEKDEEEPKKKKKKKDGEEEDEWKWWLEETLTEGRKWASLEHNGVMFAEPYQAHGVKFYYNGQPVDLSPAAEEVATFYAKYLETDYPKKENFNTNFWGEFRTYLTAEQKKVIKDFSKADFTHIHKYLVAQKELKANRTPEQKKAEKEEKAKLAQKYGYAIVNGHKQKISNWAIERPGLFLGRGAHPKSGLVKKRIEAEDITINIGKGVPVPEPPPGHKWAKVVHDDKVAWLAMWKENINNGFKYVWLHASSAVKGRSDMKKFEVARKLKDHIEAIRKQYYKELDSDELETRQRSTALYLIDRLALRVGNEKDTEDTADTVGCCSLRVEHVTLKEPTSVTLDFLGKDSMRYFNTVDVDPRIFKNLSEFMYKSGNRKSPKKPDADLFDQLTTSSLNKYLKGFMENLSAKVFRTYNASLTLEKELAKMPENLKNATNDEKVLFYNRCNREVAILCNHQKSLSKTHAETMGKIDGKIAEFEHKKDKLLQQIAYLKGKGKKPVLTDSEDDDDESSTPKKKATPKKETPKKESAKSESTKKRKKDDDEDSNDFEEETPKKKAKRTLPDDIDKCKAQIERVEASIHRWNIKKTEREELKSVALTTSKINYIDPRITAAWAKKVDLPIDKLFSKSLREKFPWAMDVKYDWKF